MSNLRLQLSAPRSARKNTPQRPLGRHLVDAGAIENADLLHALNLQHHVDAPLGEILIAEGLLKRPQMLRALAQQHDAQLVDLDRDPPRPHLAGRLPVAQCMKFRVVPWIAIGDTLLVATSKPHEFEEFRRALGANQPTMLPVIADMAQIQQQLSRLFGPTLASQAAVRVPARESCRTWRLGKRRLFIAMGVALLLLGCMMLAPLWMGVAATMAAIATLAMTTTLKLLSLGAQLLSKTPERSARPTVFIPSSFRLPKVSVLVPLLKEKEIAGQLIKRLTRLTYPKSQLNIILVLEQSDEITRATIERTKLPSWITVIEVPEADKLTTKPRALNYALDFCEGSIIGVWDAEDAPEPDQIERIVHRFQQAPGDVACLQGVLDYYNARANWLSRCFTIEYATWWRMILPGAARLGLILPLGGTTLFFRRDILEKLRGWDAHNVTEDADLGMRLARHGYRTELVPTVTYEEANCRVWPWIRQRSRWLKGFLITWCVHMRDPIRLLREVGLIRFLGLQTMLLATFCQFAFAPLLWSFWLVVWGYPHPVADAMGHSAILLMASFFIFAETLNLILAGIAVSGQEHRHLMPWVLTTPLYFTLGAVAAAKALYEFIVSPFFWDKTEHGVTPDPD
ncbi:MAG: glycosyltransferase [Pseudomonadota bacterium]